MAAMDQIKRFAVYYAPRDGAFASRAAEWLGRDDRGRDASSGTYFATLSIDGARTGATRKMSLVR